jgi:hypothetical protein
LTSTDTTSSTTSTTLSTCNRAAGDPQLMLMCTGGCPQGFACLYTGAQGNPCGCAPVESACDNVSNLQCGTGLCPGGLQACTGLLESCTCLDIG